MGGKLATIKYRHLQKSNVRKKKEKHTFTAGIKEEEKAFLTQSSYKEQRKSFGPELFKEL